MPAKRSTNQSGKRYIHTEPFCSHYNNLILYCVPVQGFCYCTVCIELVLNDEKYCLYD